MPVISFSPDERLRLSQFSKIDLGGFVIQEEHVKGISANANARKYLKLTLQGSQCGNTIVAALAPLHGSLDRLDLQRHPNCAGNPRFSQDKTEFGAFTKLRILCALPHIVSPVSHLTLGRLRNSLPTKMRTAWARTLSCRPISESSTCISTGPMASSFNRSIARDSFAQMRRVSMRKAFLGCLRFWACSQP